MRQAYGTVGRGGADAPATPRPIETVWKTGYRFGPPTDEPSPDIEPRRERHHEPHRERHHEHHDDRTG
ncbi:hypothetical protein AAW14_11270 [Streptomyces hygroscopicus]|uniref:hypothetical protein n=1 Tax=Streptomyces hygroscopicus TaxID=1912 RepID=UPI00224069EA|nr:hypothetical protein [Streptomyces hygroscopicus]MCW7942624.1 hypothetical protein [Streptomyces hygroscopicus]